MDIQYLGHSSFLIRTKGKSLLLDPFITGNPKAQSVDLSGIRPDYILLSHGHGDHVSDAVRIGQTSQSHVVGVFEIVAWFESQGLQGTGMNTGGKAEFPFGTVKLVNAVHSSQLPDGSYGANPVGFVIWNDEACLYFAGDTALTMDMQLIPMICPPLDVAILPLGDHFTMGVDDAVIAAKWLKAQRVIGCHFDTFPPIQIDHDKAKRTFQSHNVELILPLINQTISL